MEFKKEWRGSNPKLTAEQRAEVKKLYRAGETQKALAQKYGVSQPTISNILNLKTAGREAFTYPRKLTDEQKEEIERLYREGATMPELAEKFGVAVSTICYAVNPSARERQRETQRAWYLRKKRGRKNVK